MVARKKINHLTLVVFLELNSINQDNFDRARATSSPAGEAEQARNDLYDQLHADLMTALGGLGLEQFESLGKEFDVNLHMAVQQMPSEGAVAQALQVARDT